MKYALVLITLFLTHFAFANEICRPEEFVEGGPQPVVGVVNFAYSPRCLHVAPGTTVTIQASGMHPLNGDATPGNPFFLPSGGSPVVTSKVAAQPGRFIFYCIHHGSSAGQGMAGELLVQ